MPVGGGYQGGGVVRSAAIDGVSPVRERFSVQAQAGTELVDADREPERYRER
jgi:hypothetical protein